MFLELTYFLNFWLFFDIISDSFYRATVRLHVMQRTVLSRPFCSFVCLFVCPSAKRLLCDKMKETCGPHFYTTWKTIHSSLLTRRMDGGERPLPLVIFRQNDHVWAKTPIFNRYSFVVLRPRMILNGVKALISPNSIALQVDHVTVVDYR